jgi:hypothetical protein
MIYEVPKGTAMVDLYLAEPPVLDPSDPPTIPSGATVDIYITYLDSGDLGVKYAGTLYTVEPIYIYRV